MKHFSFKAIASTLFFFGLNVALLGQSMQPYELLRAEILKNFPAVRATQEIKKGKNGVSFPGHKLSPYEMHDILLQFLGGDKNTEEVASCLDAKSITDLNLFFYNIDRPDYTVLESTYRGASLNGKIAQAKWMVMPSTNQNELEMRQNLARYFMARPQLGKTLAALFKELATLEEKMYSLWNDNDLIYSKFAQETFYKGSQKRYRGNNDAVWLEFNRRMNDIKPLISIAKLEIGIGLLSRLLLPYGYHKMAEIPFSEARRRVRDGHDDLRNVLDLPGLGPWTPVTYNLLRNIASIPDFISGKKEFNRANALITLSALAIVVPIAANMPTWWKSVQTYKAFVTYLRTRFAVFVKWRRIVLDIYKTIREEQFLCDNLEGFSDLSAFANGENTKLKKFFGTVSSSTFTSNSYCFANVGKVLQAVPQFLRIQDEFRPLFKTLGALEAYLSIGTLIDEKNASPTPWSFARYATMATPYLNLADYSHPLIPADKSVLNTIVLGENGHQGMIVTGPNASGKSMNIRSIALCLLLSQSLGIAPARNAVLTPMSKMLTYLNPVDNIAEGRSLFQAEEDRINYIVQTTTSLPASQFAFIVADELLSSTAPKEGEAATFGICYGLSKYPNCMPIMATHFVKLTALPQDTNGFYMNYHVSVIKKPNGNFTHPFKLEPGRAHQVIAIDLARQQGFDPAILDFADQFLKEQGIERGRLI